MKISFLPENKTIWTQQHLSAKSLSPVLSLYLSSTPSDPPGTGGVQET